MAIRVLLARPDLSQAVVHLLRRAGLAPDVEGHPALPGDVVVTTSTECTAAQCRRASRAGVAIVVLAAFPTESEEASYRDAGAAAYVPMGTPSSADIAGVVLAAARRARHAA